MVDGKGVKGGIAVIIKVTEAKEEEEEEGVDMKRI